MGRRGAMLLAAVVTVLAVGCDQGTKLGAVAGLTDAAATGSASSTDASSGSTWASALEARHPRAQAVVTVVPGYWDLQYSENEGAAFSALRAVPPDVQRAGLLAAAVLGVLLLSWVAWRGRDRWTVAGASLALGGALGNAIDRARLGYVVDFVHWHLGDAFHWPIFNVADAALAIGVGLLLWGRFRARPTPAGAGSPA